MSANTAQYNINFTTNGGVVLPGLTKGMDGVRASVEKTTKTFGDCYKSLMSVSLAAQGLSELKSAIDNVIAPGVSLNSNMAELSAITGVTGEGLKAIEMAARQTAKTFGTSAVQNVESYKLILSQLSPEIANNSEAMKMMGENVNILSKQMGGDTVAATEVLTTSMNQYGVSLKDPIAASKVMADMMNVMSAGAQAGSAELPQIKNALEQVGMVAKTTGISFVDLNAQIQVLDKAGKKGSEGGVALRNVLTTLSEGRFTSKHAAEGLEAAGISVEYLANQSIPLTDRLRTLRKIQGDTALMTKVFGKENMAAAIAMVQGADEADELSKQITGTSSAMDQADTIMGSYQEKMNRTRAWLDDLKISVFNAAQPFLPMAQNVMTAFVSIGQMANGVQSLSSIIGALNIKTWFNTAATEVNTGAQRQGFLAKMRLNVATYALAANMNLASMRMGINSVIARIQASGIRSVAIAFGQATLGATAFQIALDALGIGLILAGIAALVAGLKYLWDHSKRFREILFGIGYAGAAVFHNIGVFVGRLWNWVIKPIATAWFDMYAAIFSGIWDAAVTAFNWIKQGVISVYRTFVSVFIAIWNAAKSVFTAIANFVGAVWNWIKQTFSGFASWIDKALIQPIYGAFSGVWNWLVKLFDNIMNRLSGFLAPIRELWNKLFSGNGMKDIKVSYKEGEKAGAKSFDKDQANKKAVGKPQEVKVVNDNHKAVFDVSKGYGVSTPTIGGVAAKSAKNKDARNKSQEGGSADSGNKTRSLNINKLIENLIINNQNGTTMSKEAIIQMVREALLTASADFTLAE